MRHIDADRRHISTSEFEVIEYEHLLSTMPLDQFATQIKQTTPSLRKLAQRLKHSTSNIIGLGFRGRPPEQLRTKCWMYFPEGDYPFYRMTVFSNYSPRNVPTDDCYSLMCEISESSHKPVDRSRMVEETLQSLVRGGLVPVGHDCISRWSYSASYGYPTPCLERNSILSEIIPALDRLETYSRGRFGGWKYEVSNQDHSFMQGVEWVDRILHDDAETTYRVDTAADPNLGAIRQLRK